VTFRFLPQTAGPTADRCQGHSALPPRDRGWSCHHRRGPPTENPDEPLSRLRYHASRFLDHLVLSTPNHEFVPGFLGTGDAPTLVSLRWVQTNRASGRAVDRSRDTRWR